MAKIKKIKLQDKLSALLEEKIRNASLRDIAFIASWAAGTYIAYKGIGFVDAFSLDLPDILSDYLLALFGRPIPEKGWEPGHLALAMIASYKLLTSDMEDIQSALNAVKGGLSVAQ